MSKKGQEISINVVVGIIMGLLMLGAGIALFVQIVNKTEDTTLIVDKSIQEKYLNVFNDNDQLFLPTDVAKYAGKTLEFYYGIHNINNEDTNFNVEITSMDLEDGSTDPGDIPKSSIRYLEDGVAVNIPARDKKILKFIVTDVGKLSKGQHLIKINILEVKSDGTTEVYTNPRTIKVNK